LKVEIISTVAELSEIVQGLRKSCRTIGVVPTMGALHEGHLSLAGASLAANDETIATVFLNPTQFATQEDLSRYPRTLVEKSGRIGTRKCVIFSLNPKTPKGTWREAGISTTDTLLNVVGVFTQLRSPA